MEIRSKFVVIRVTKKPPYRATINYLRLNKNYDKVYIFSFGRILDILRREKWLKQNIR